MNHQRGLTPVNLLLLLVLIVVAVAVAIPIYTGFINKARSIQAVSEITGLKYEILMYEIQTGHRPATLAELGKGHVTDPWGRPYHYRNIAGKTEEPRRKDRLRTPLNSDYDLYSAGMDGGSSLDLAATVSLDDVVRGHDGAYVGLASEY